MGIALALYYLVGEAELHFLFYDTIITFFMYTRVGTFAKRATTSFCCFNTAARYTYITTHGMHTAYEQISICDGMGIWGFHVAMGTASGVSSDEGGWLSKVSK